MASRTLPASLRRRAPQPLEQGRRLKATRGIYPVNNKLYATSRPYSTEASAAEVVTTGIALLPHRRLISLSGPDAAKFLQGLITNNVDSTRLSPFYSAFLDARGRVLWDVFVWVWPELVAQEGNWACYIEVDADELETLKKHLKKHKLRSKLAIKDVPAEGTDGIRVWAAWGGAHKNVETWTDIAGMEDPRCPGMYRYLANADRASISEALQPVDAKFYHTQRYLEGIPEGQHEIQRETTLPMECNIDLNGGIDFKKGCYLGQELTIRTKHTGVVRKRVLPVRFDTIKPRQTTTDELHADNTGTYLIRSVVPQLPFDAGIKQLDGAGALKGRAVGKIIAAIGNIGLASCRLENMTPMKVSAEGGTYKPGMQFGVDVDEEIVRVKPILHEWFLQRKDALWNKEDRKKVKEKEDVELD
ncbi:putative transferase CAF17, mitochondrial [Phaeosphaeriaceae sp. PMI808]|nr:putative transferase CAF17, mitochondrial [Phaeosphaeriaceae sp. PMI808]